MNHHLLSWLAGCTPTVGGLCPVVFRGSACKGLKVAPGGHSSEVGTSGGQSGV